MSPKCHIELVLLADGAITLQGQLGERLLRAGAVLVPSEALRLLEEWLARIDQGEITVIVRGENAVLATWTTQSPSFALYWAAAVLGHSWEPGKEAKPAEHESEEREDAPAQTQRRKAESVIRRRAGASELPEADETDEREDVA